MTRVPPDGATAGRLADRTAGIDPTGGGEGASAPVLSARGTRLNRRGLRTREQLLAAAVQCLADGGPEAASANAIARRAGVTWGTVQHQFGDVDGLWAAVLDHVSELAGPVLIEVPASLGLQPRVTALVDLLWGALQRPEALAIHRLRACLPHRLEQLEESFPHTARALAAWERQWADLCGRAFAGLDVDPVRIERTRRLLPGAMRGLAVEGGLSPALDPEEARAGLVDAVTAYLTGPPPAPAG